jgi:putative copper export protein
VADPLEDVVLRAAQWGNLGGLMVAAGAVVFLLVVWNRYGSFQRPESVEASFIHRLRRTVIASWAVAVLASIPLLIWGTSLWAEVTRLALLVIGGMALFAGWRRGGSLGAIALPALLALLVSAALSGHARSSSLPLPNFVVALVHVTAAAAWVGGLFMLVAAAFPAVRGQAQDNRARLLAPVVARFSDLAVWSVFAVVASGTYSAWMAIGGMRALTDSTYGLVFLAKMGAFLPVLVLGGVNNRWTKPRLLRAAREETSGSRALVILRRLVALEVTLVALVLAFTVFLLQLSPPTSQPGAL